MLIVITQDARGRFVVADARRQLGAYRTRAMAEYRAAQVARSRRPRRNTQRRT